MISIVHIVGWQAGYEVLVIAIIRQAIRDIAHRKHHRDITAFFSSTWLFELLVLSGCNDVPRVVKELQDKYVERSELVAKAKKSEEQEIERVA